MVFHERISKGNGELGVVGVLAITIQELPHPAMSAMNHRGLPPLHRSPQDITTSHPQHGSYTSLFHSFFLFRLLSSFVLLGGLLGILRKAGVSSKL